VIRGLEATVKLLQSLGHEVVEATPQYDYAELAMAFMTMIAGQTRNDIRDTAALVGKRPARSDFELLTWVIGLLGNAFTAADYVHATRVFGMTARAIGAFFAEYDVLLTPTLPRPPVAVGALQPTPAEQRTAQHDRHTACRQAAHRARPGAADCASRPSAMSAT
jgi:amidase